MWRMKNKSILKKTNKIFSLDLFKGNFLIYFSFVFLTLLGVVYINRSLIDVAFLDGLMPLPMVEKYFQGNLSFKDINMNWGEHRLIGYSLIFLFNTIFFHLNMKLESYIFLMSYLIIGLILYFVYKDFLVKALNKKVNKWMTFSYLPILFLIFSLVHPPGMLMTTQFIVGTLFFVTTSVYLNKIFLGSKRNIDLIFFLMFMLIYILIFSGANFGGMLLGFLISFLLKIFIFEKKKPSLFLTISIIYTILLVTSYIFLNTFDNDGVSLLEKVFIFFSRFGESFLSLLAGISATTLDIHTFEELLGGRNVFVLINGSVLFLLGMYSAYKYIFLKIYRFSYMPIFLIMYSLGFIFISRLGRLDGGWMWPMNDWYSLHLYFYLIGILWILFYDVFEKYTQLSTKSLKIFFKNYLWTLIIFIFSIFWIFSFQLTSNLAQWRRGPYVREWLETKRMALIDQTDENLEALLWTKEESLKAIDILKKYKLSVFRDGGYVDKQNGLVKLSGWNSDGWIGRDAKIMIVDSKEGILSMNFYIPADVFNDVYKNSIVLKIINGEKIIGQREFVVDSFNKGPIDVIFDIPKNEVLNLEIKLDKSFVPVNYGLGKDERDLGIIVNDIKVN
jgi:hypothetical protein